MGQELYKEVQKITQKWIWGWTLLPTTLIAILIVRDFFDNEEIVAETVFSMDFIFILLPIIIFSFLKSYAMKTVITTKGVYIKTKPLGLTSKFYSWADVEAARMDAFEIHDDNFYELDMPYSAFHEFKWAGIFKKKLVRSVYSVRGKQALKLRMKSGADVYIGTQKPEEIKEVLKILIASGMGEEYILGIKFFENKT